MPVELRKRKAHQQPQVAAPPPKKKSTTASKVTKAAEKVKKAVTPKAAPEKEEKKEEKEEKNEESEELAPKKEEQEKPKAEAKKPTGKVAPGDIITLEGFGGEILTNDGEKTTLKELVEKSKAGVVLFTYPKASTPGCTLALLAPYHIYVLLLTRPRH